MMGNSRTNQKDNPPASANPLLESNVHPSFGVTFLEGNVAGGHFESIPDMSLPVSGWENMYSMNQSVAQGIPEPSGNPMAYLMNPNSFQNPQMSLNSNTVNTDLPGVPSLPEWNVRWDNQFINQGHNAISAGGMNDVAGISNFKNPTISRNFTGDIQMSRHGGESNFESFNAPQVNRDIAGSSFQFRPIDTVPVHTRNNANFNTSQSGSFLSLGIGGTEEAISRSQLDSDRLKEAASAELKLARARRAMGQTLDADFSLRNRRGFSNQFSHVDQMTLTNNKGQGSRPYHVLKMQQNDTDNCSSSSNIRSGDLDHYRAFVGNQAVHSGTVGENSDQLFYSQLHDLNKLAPESAKPSWMASPIPSGQLQNTRFGTANSLPSVSSMSSPSLGLGSCSTRQNYPVSRAEQLLSQNVMPTQGLFSQRTALPQVAWVGSGQHAATDAPFPKRLGVEFNGRDSLQAAQKHLSLMGTRLQTTSTGQISQFPDKGSNCLPNHVPRPSIDRTVGTPVTYPLNSQESFFNHGQSQNASIQIPKDPRGAASTNGQLQDALIQLHKDPSGATSTNALTISGLSQKSDFHMRPYHKRPAGTPAPAPHPASHWVQRQKIITNPTVHHSMPNPLPTKPAVPVTTAPVRRSLPCSSRSRPRVPVTTAPTVSHITWKDPDATPKLSGYKCLLCKRDLSLTSEGAVYQPSKPPAVAVLPCGHTFHDQCLANITPQDESKDPPCIPCAIGEN